MRILWFGSWLTGLVWAQIGQPAAPLTGAINRGLPGWLRLEAQERVRVEGIRGEGFGSGRDQYLLQRFRLGFEAQPRSWLRMRAEAQDARVFGQSTRPAPASQKDPLDLRVGFLELGSGRARAGFRLGRQSLIFGEGRVLADPGWSNTGRTFDAARLTLRSRKTNVDMFSGMVVRLRPDGGLNRPEGGSHLHGIYAAFKDLAPGAVIEPYLLWRLERNFRNESGAEGRMNQRTVGFRWAGPLGKGFDYEMELIGQTGARAGDQVRAWAGNWTLGRTFSGLRGWRAYAELNRASGDQRRGDGRQSNFDPLYPSVHDKLGLADLFSWTNLVHWRSGAEFTLSKGFKLGAAYNSFWLANPGDGLYMGGRAVARNPEGAARRHVGQEADVQFHLRLGRWTNINAGYSRLLPGAFLRRTTPGLPYHIVFCNITQDL